jgi:biotin operon repressor
LRLWGRRGREGMSDADTDSRGSVAVAGVPGRVKDMHRLYVEDFLSLAAVGARFGVSRQRVSQLFQKADLPVRRRGPRGPAPSLEVQIEAAHAALEAADQAADCALTETAYEGLRARLNPSWPSANGGARVLGDGSWPRALRAVGVATLREHQLARVALRREQILTLWPGELTAAEIADVLDTTPAYVSHEVSRLRRLGYELADRRGRRAA